MTENEREAGPVQANAAGIPAVVDIDPDQVGIPALRRLLEEVQNEAEPVAVGGHYDRTHNRHNRGR